MAFSVCSSLTNVFFAGNEDVWNNINIGSGNSRLTSAPYFHCNASDPDTHFKYTVLKEPGCTEDGKSVYICSCGHAKDDKIIPATGHSYENSVCIHCGEVESKSITYGDVNSDEKVNLADVTKVLQYIAKWELEDFNKDAADVNADSKINLSDATKMLKYIAKWDNIVLGSAD